MGEQSDLDLYVYADEDPVGNADPTGDSCVKDTGSLICQDTKTNLIGVSSDGKTAYVATTIAKSGRLVSVKSYDTGKADGNVASPGDFLGGPVKLDVEAVGEILGPLFVKGAEEAAGDCLVYCSKTAAGDVNYVGITEDLGRRAAEQAASKGISIQAIPGLSNLSRADARAVEQVLIETHGLGKNGGTLINKINSIATTNPSYAAALARGIQLLSKVKYPGF